MFPSEERGQKGGFRRKALDVGGIFAEKGGLTAKKLLGKDQS